MHLSILSDAFMSNQGNAFAFQDEGNTRLAHWHGMLRGLALLFVFALVIALTMVSNATPTHETVTHFDDLRTAQLPFMTRPLGL